MDWEAQIDQLGLGVASRAALCRVVEREDDRVCAARATPDSSDPNRDIRPIAAWSHFRSLRGSLLKVVALYVLDVNRKCGQAPLGFLTMLQEHSRLDYATVFVPLFLQSAVERA
jgi:hypothetical protein